MRLPATRTPIGVRELRDAFARVWPEAPKASIELLVGHVSLETGWCAECWNYDLGNAKYVDGDSDYCERECGEELPERAVPLGDPLLEIVRRYQRNGVPYVSVKVHPPHAWSRFRAFRTLDEGARYHVDLLRSRYASALPALAAGDAVGYAKALANAHYYTADPGQYARSLVAVLGEVRAKLTDAKLHGADALHYLEQLATPRPGESPGAYAARFVRGLDGAQPGGEGVLYQLAARVEIRPATEQYRATNCATSMRWIWAWLGCPHPWATMPDEQLRSLAPAGPVHWCLEIARAQGALVECRGKDVYDVAGEGWGLHYATPGCNDDHMEWVLDPDLKDPKPDEHGGGGRSGNRITVERGDVHLSMGRPVLHAIDPSRMGFRKAPDDVPTLPDPPVPSRPPVAEPVTGETRAPVASIVGSVAATAAVGSAVRWWIGLLVVAVAVAAALFYWRARRRKSSVDG